ncbi:MAG: hypothetical protein HY898_22965 [Deltaproteobacteria bacterium]|nr:hypothetical protein [Deltaproteobacteria bacterium]
MRALVTSCLPGFGHHRGGGKPALRVWDFDVVHARAEAGEGPVDPPLPDHARVPIEPDDTAEQSPLDARVVWLNQRITSLPDQVELTLLDEPEWADSKLIGSMRYRPAAGASARALQPLADVACAHAVASAADSPTSSLRAS